MRIRGRSLVMRECGYTGLRRGSPAFAAVLSTTVERPLPPLWLLCAFLFVPLLQLGLEGADFRQEGDERIRALGKRGKLAFKAI